MGCEVLKARVCVCVGVGGKRFVCFCLCLGRREQKYVCVFVLKRYSCVCSREGGMKQVFLFVLD